MNLLLISLESTQFKVRSINLDVLLMISYKLKLRLNKYCRQTVLVDKTILFLNIYYNEYWLIENLKKGV